MPKALDFFWVLDIEKMGNANLVRGEDKTHLHLIISIRPHHTKVFDGYFKCVFFFNFLCMSGEMDWVLALNWEITCHLSHYTGDLCMISGSKRSWQGSWWMASQYEGWQTKIMWYIIGYHTEKKGMFSTARSADSHNKTEVDLDRQNTHWRK